MKKFFTIIFLSLFLISCGNNKKQILFENNLKCSDIAIKYTNLIWEKILKEDPKNSLLPILRKYFYSEKRNTCIWSFYYKNEFEKETTLIVDLLNWDYLEIFDWEKTINLDF